MRILKHHGVSRYIERRANLNLDALYALNCGMYILCSGWEGKFNGLIVNALTQVTAFPPQLVGECKQRKFNLYLYTEKWLFFSISSGKNTPSPLIGLLASAVVEILTNYLKLNTAWVRQECPSSLNIQWLI